MTRSSRAAGAAARDDRPALPAPRWRRVLPAALLAVVAFVAWALLAPPLLGGRTSYVVTSGTSMLPTFHTGDLAVVRERPSYAVGDVVAYRSPTVGITVLHRVIAAGEDGFRFRGDSNTWDDPDLVPADALVGELWFHVPGAGRFLGPARLVVPVLAAGAVLLVLAAGRRSRRRTAPDAATASAPPTPAGSGGDRASRLSAAATAGLVAGAVLLVVSARLPVSAAATSSDVAAGSAAPTAAAPTATVGYTAAADPLVYDDGRLVTGDPVWTALTPGVDVTVDVSTPEDAVLGVEVLLSTDDGWRRTVVLDGTAVVEDGTARLRVPLDVARLEAVVARVRERTGSSGGVRVRLLPRLAAADGTVTTPFPDGVAFRLGAGQLVLDVGDHEHGEPVQLTAAAPGAAAPGAAAAAGAGTAARGLDVAGLSIGSDVVRAGGLGVVGLSAALAAVPGVVRRRRPRPVPGPGSAADPAPAPPAAPRDEPLDAAPDEPLDALPPSAATTGVSVPTAAADEPVLPLVPPTAQAQRAHRAARLAVAVAALGADPSLTAAALLGHLAAAGHPVSLRTAQRVRREALQLLPVRARD
ncbi:signal peptidase I [Kineococcus sp. SYSU DK004]|uniref:signal peptidase I n=1 Tax=Kineococcus sp. SYSU DK004 TaxID=3383125 RepID=UPI003D7CE682